MYNDNFRKLVSICVETNTFIGEGNPSSQILLVGKEGSNEGEDDNLKNCKKWEFRINDNNKIDFSYPFIEAAQKAGHTWNKYQKLHNYIYPELKSENLKFNFHERIFTTEMNVKPNKNTAKAKLDEGFNERIRIRKSKFLSANFIQDFKVIILACSDYIQNIGEGKEREIDNIFGVIWDKAYLVYFNNKEYRFDTHYNNDKSKLVIHCRQLSGSIPNKYLQEMGAIIQDFIQLPKHLLH
jgi:hypothetical protein